MSDPHFGEIIRDVHERFTEPQLIEALYRCGVPSHMHDGYLLYIRDGIRPGSFLCAVLSNNLEDACNRADLENRHALFAHVVFLANHAPRGCWGSPAAVDAWVDNFALWRRAERLSAEVIRRLT